MKGTVYKCTFSDGKVYIGKSIHADLRMLQHMNINSGPCNPGFYDAYKRLGEPSYEILYEEDFSNEIEREVSLCSVEMYYIDFFNATDPEYGYNRRMVSSFSPGIRKKLDDLISEITQELLKERLKIYYNIIDKLWYTKEKLTDEELNFIKTNYRDQNPWQQHIDDFDFDDYSNNSIEDLEFLVDDAIPFIKFMIEDETEQEASNYVFSNFDELIKNGNDKVILQINNQGEIIKEYQTMNEICESLNILRPDNIRNVLRGKQHTAYGFIWRYKNEYLEEKKSIDKGVRNDV